MSPDSKFLLDLTSLQEVEAMEPAQAITMTMGRAVKFEGHGACTWLEAAAPHSIPPSPLMTPYTEGTRAGVWSPWAGEEWPSDRRHFWKPLNPQIHLA